MQEFFRKLSRGTIAFLVISIAIVVILAQDPPHNICHSERDQFLSVQKSFLNADPGLKKVFKKAKTPQQRLFQSCKESGNSGGCLEYFIKLKKFTSDFNVISSTCKKEAMGNKKVKKVFKESTELLVKLAWGSQEDIKTNGRFAWFDQSDLTLFCELKDGLQQGLSKSSWESLRESIMESLSGSDNLSRDQLWKSSILSIPCKQLT